MIQKTASIRSQFSAWDSIIAFRDKGVSFFRTNSSKFFPENPMEFIAGLQRYRQTGNISPVRVDIDITNLCNNSCIMCFNSDFRTQHTTQIPRDKVVNIMGDLANLGVKSLRFTGGGDPLVHPDLKMFIVKAHELNFKITIESNGDGLNDDLIETICKYASHFRVSVDSACDETRKKVHRAIRVDFTYSRLLRAIEKVVAKRQQLGREAELLLGATFLILPQNYQEIRAFVLALKQIGVDWVAIRRATSWAKGLLCFKQSTNIIEEAQMQLELLKEEQTDTFKIVGPYGVTFTPQQDFERCLISATRLIVLADSNAQMCCLARNSLNRDQSNLGHLGDVLDPVTELFQKNTAKIQEFFRRAPGFCTSCIDLDFNHFLNSVWNILNQYEAAIFQRMRIFFHDGDHVLITQRVGQTDIALVGIPAQYQNPFNRGQVINIDRDLQAHPALERLEYASKN